MHELGVTVSPPPSVAGMGLEAASAVSTGPLEARVLVIATGGTICMKRGVNGYVPEANFINLLIPRPSFNDNSNPPPLPCHADPENPTAVTHIPSLRTPLSAYGKHVRFCVLEFDPLLDSSSINAKGWGEIARAIERNYQLFDAFIVLHGTDSLAYTASALGFMINSLGKAIILTGSQAPMTELQSDATDNLLGSLVIAGHFMIPEVCLYFNFKLFRGNRVTKCNAVAFNAFASPNHPPLATVGINITINWNMITRPSTLAPFAVSPYPPGTSHVACLRIFPGILPEMVEGVMRLKGLRGLVLETFGSGNAPEDERLLEVLRKGVEDGVVVVNVTQCMTGSVSPLYATGMALAKTGVVFGMDMTSEAALTKLSCLLADPTLTLTSIRSMMSKSLRGEITEMTLPTFAHPQEPPTPNHPSTLAPKQASLSALGYAIKSCSLPSVLLALQQSKADHPAQFLLNEFDYAGFTPMHIAATSPCPDILREFLKQGASVHLRTMQDGHTPLFLAAENGLVENVRCLREAGAHLHAEEVEVATLLRKRLEEGGSGGSGWVTPVGVVSEGGNNTNNGNSNNNNGGGEGNKPVLLGDVFVEASKKESEVERRVRRVKCWELAGAGAQLEVN
ncbi:asparaginase-domain-containing protein [Peziza echinospora]|nr:asparaginase-domain-containing protein [Peziza echinospora]